jgi:hypothetical protein
MLLLTSRRHGYVNSVVVATWNERNKLIIRNYRDLYILHTKLVFGICENKSSNLDTGPWLCIEWNLWKLEGSMRRNYYSISISL